MHIDQGIMAHTSAAQHMQLTHIFDTQNFLPYFVHHFWLQRSIDQFPYTLIAQLCADFHHHESNDHCRVRIQSRHTKHGTTDTDQHND